MIDIEVKKICMQLKKDADDLDSLGVVNVTWTEGAEVIDDEEECMEVAIEFMKGRERTSSYTLKEFVCTFRLRGIIDIKVLVKILQHSKTCIGPDF